MYEIKCMKTCIKLNARKQDWIFKSKALNLKGNYVETSRENDYFSY